MSHLGQCCQLQAGKLPGLSPVASRHVVARAGTAGSGGLPKRSVVEPVYFPPATEERASASAAFHAAFAAARPSTLSIPGLQEYAAALWTRRRNVSSSGDPLLQIFDEVDTDSDGKVTGTELARTFESRGVAISAEQCQELINLFCPGTTILKRDEFPTFMGGLATGRLQQLSCAVPQNTTL
mmetsp:Transcript_9282/g.16383  ORF Transcript_9282/g.16383 Transcript_9282/m.16383 type:complete len:182 (+) Transcript_9282:77-622(+)|eukprot:CAMPEP_0119106724 /NCGR_PEP_ID=MMETSP1180-20130426/6285_1 /TAXON_ID=3052 ORGANISM="Chlamydomonas cf sp, Strain CCMP681" /NCGR_SAMPLE_ID=MMETSP1180 /ASSEMBLY_ACC=CAM_ASM_000741 /LENGTH=181 /DNA_ID=CAMNT_0007092105 /DNA_START=76 /DNA_END=621 /DNA_ORIENTATION=-